MTRRILALLGMTAALAAGPALAEDQVNFENYKKTVFSGGTINLDRFYDINPDCSSNEKPEFRIVEKPTGGKVAIVPGSDFPVYGKDNARSVCNNRRVPGRVLRYTAKADYKGSDTVSVEIVWQNGEFWKRLYVIDVR